MENDISKELDFARWKLTRIYDLIGDLEYDLNKCFKKGGGVDEIKKILENYGIIVD